MSDRAPIQNLPPLSSIKDPDVRVALESMWNAWRVRNGDVGDGEHKFLTQADLLDAINGSGTVRGNGGSLGVGSAKGGGAQWVGPLIDSIQDSIMQSWLWKKLDERITWIDTPEWFLERADRSYGTAIKNEEKIREGADSSLASSIKTVSAVLNDNIALVQQTLTANVTLTESTANSLTLLKSEFDDAVAGFQEDITTVANSVSALSTSTTTLISQINDNIGLIEIDLQSVTDTAGTHTSQITTLQNDVGDVQVAAQEAFDLATTVDGLVKGSWTVKFDANGYITGAGLGLEGKNGSYTSTFLVRADRFAIGTPSAPSIAPKVPFVVYTTPTTISGRVVEPGVYMDSAFITRIVADQIDTRGLSIKDANGNVILASGTSLDWSLVGGTSKPADNATKNTISYSTSAPSSPTNGDIWVNTSAQPYTINARINGAWLVSGNYTTDTSQLNDGAGLGDTAFWSGVSGTGKPADNATKNNIYRQSSQPASGMSVNDVWFNTSTQATYYYNGSSWILAGDRTSLNTAAYITNQGSFATLSKITPTNVSTYIESLAVKTLQIDDNAVTIPASQQSFDARYGDGSIQVINQMSYYLPYAGSLLVIFNGRQNYDYGSRNTGLALYLDGVETVPLNIAGAINDYANVSWSGALGAGWHTIQIVWHGQDGSVRISSRTLSVLGAMK